VFSGLHGDYEWDLINGKLLVSSRNRKVGSLRTFDAPRSFNNAEQAQWFAQGRIDIHGDELARIEQDRLLSPPAPESPPMFHGPSAEAARALLRAAGLPAADLPDDLPHFLGCGERASPLGIVGLEDHDGDALLRSLVVASAARGRGYGRALVSAAENQAADLHLRRIYLLTETARDFFASLGYSEVDRSSAPESIQATREFAELCPASATFMAKAIESRPPDAD
jgi:amino-acid N-acetyltransferase